MTTHLPLGKLMKSPKLRKPQIRNLVGEQMVI